MEIQLDNTLWVIGSISGATILLPLVAGCLRYKKLSVSMHILLLLLLYSSINTAVTSWLAIKGINNLLFINIFTLVELTLLGWVFHRVFESRGLKGFTMVAILACAAFSVINLFFIQGLSAINSYSLALGSMLLTVLALLFYYKIFREEKVQRLERYPLFWLSSGVLLYFAGNLFVFLFSSYVLSDSPNALYAEWSIHSVLYIMTNLIYTAAFWLSPQK